MIHNFDNWLNESDTDESRKFFETLVSTIKKEGAEKFKRIVVRVKYFDTLDNAKAAYDKRGGPQNEDFEKKLSKQTVGDMDVTIHFHPSQLGKIKSEAGKYYLFDLKSIELLDALEPVDPSHKMEDDPRHDLLDDFVKEIYDRLLKEFYPTKRTSRHYGI